MRLPDAVIGELDDPQLLRWHLIPRNPFFNIYLHHILRADDGRVLHDHQYWNVSVILKGAYNEVTADSFRTRISGDVVFRFAKTPHRIAFVSKHLPTWTLFITGPRFRQWGFHCPNGWRPWWEYVDMNHVGRVGRGCD